MTDDIVARLRRDFGPWNDQGFAFAAEGLEAASVIERLRTELAEAERIVADYRGMTIHEYLRLRGVTQVDVDVVGVRPGEMGVLALQPETLRYHAGNVPADPPAPKRRSLAQLREDGVICSWPEAGGGGHVDYCDAPMPCSEHAR